MKKLILLAGIGIGYVLGSKAGRERYEQIRAGASKVAESPTVQTAAAKATEQAAAAAEVAKEKVTEAASTVADKARREASIQPAP
ncbi:hypothetical protein [Nocardioides marmotae]|uniref:YtxH domain-containing protein n=1 Tax=Nocardioides marmotae TaxID=2663857 RepID=A0A6I3J7N2_9ACTN|nr:hypothetical protein [Nocardioides marmotae]MCR6030473.1 hypothetical protein [Gordonia jinghuaiqii]MBC9734604.1 hypothetical protein [Nocardioides marmotae]MTB85706.1 hypothetical protein [Nocardioides marmotae]MTB94109.1 hypothetical protein [Nocardioides marmotae]QKE00407.1 hypothetical protein HPC71_04425 [Nocardioides marmotae]